MCGARVLYAARDTSASCGVCDTRFAVAIGELTRSEPRQHVPDGERAPLPMTAEAMAWEKSTEEALASFASDERDRLKVAGLLWVSVVTVLAIAGALLSGAL